MTSFLTNFSLLLALICPVFTKLSPPTPLQNLQPLEAFLREHFQRHQRNIVITEPVTIVDDLRIDLHTVPILKTNIANFGEILHRLPAKPLTLLFDIYDHDQLIDLLIGNAEKWIGSVQYFVVTRQRCLVQNISDTLWSLRLPKSYVILLQKEVEVFLLDLQECGSAPVNPKAIVSLSTAPKWDLKGQLKGCVLNVIWVVMAPYVLDPNASMRGIFFETVDALSFATGRPVNYRPFDPIILEDISASYSYESVIEDFENEYADLFIGPADGQLLSIFDVSPVLLDNNMRLLIPIPFWSFWKTMLSGHFLLLTGGYMLLQFVIVAIIYFMARQTIDRGIFSSLNKTYFLFIGMFLGVSSFSRLPKTRHLQLILSTSLLQSLIVSTYVQGQWVSTITGSVYGEPIDTIDKLLASNLPIKVIPGFSYLFRIGRDERDLLLSERAEVLPSDMFLSEAGDTAKRDRSFATVVDDGYIMMRPNILKSFSVTTVFNMKLVCIMPKNVYFAEEFHMWYTRILEIGVLAKFEDIYRHYFALKHYVDEDKREYLVTFEQVKPGLFLLGAGYVLAFIVFTLEVVKSKGFTQKKV